MNLIHRFACSKILLLSLLCLFLTVCFESSAQFQQVYLDPDESNGIINTSFYSTNEGYVAFRNWIGLTTDGGRSFQQKTIGFNNVDFGLQSVSFPWTTRGVKAFDRNNILVYGEWGGVPSILSSGDGGNSFRMVFYSRIDPLHFNNGITDLVFPQNGSVGYAVDEDRIFKTVNRGQNWSLIYASVGSEFHSITAASDNNVYVYSETKMMKTSDAGLSWTQVQLPIGSIRSADFISPLKGWVVIYQEPSFNIFYTSDGGTTWQRKNLRNLPFNKITFTDDQTGYGLIGLGILKTTDSGRIWEVLTHQSPGLASGSFTTISNPGYGQLWAGTSAGLLESSGNAGGITIPAAVFAVDTAGVSATNKVNLVNYSKQGNQYKWFRNGQLISTNYHAQYSPTALKYVDTIQLVVSNGTYTSDTATQLVNFSPVIIESFSPTIAADGQTVVIKGQNFWGLDYVSFGGTRANSFTYVSPTEIHAVVGSGSTGAIYIHAFEGVAFKPGFVYNAPPKTDVGFTISDTILCKSEPIQIRLQNSEPGVDYILVDADHNNYGAVTGNGGEVVLRSVAISATNTFSIWIIKQGINRTLYLDKTVSVRVEKTQSIMGADRVNIATGELINFVQQSKEAVTYNWTLHDGASISSYTGAAPTGISYSTPGDKSATLISTSADGCKDTALLKAVTVYDKALLRDECFAQNVQDDDTYDQYYETTGLHRAQGTPDGGYILSGWGNTIVLQSRAGSTKPLPEKDMAFVAKYSATGVLLWQCNQGRNGIINETAVDDQGNVYVIGTLKIHDYFYFNNGDSMRVGHNGEKLVSFYERQNAYILKLDPNGKYLWHTILYSPLNEGQGFTVSDIKPAIIRIRDGKMILAGSFSSGINYSRKGVQQQIRTGGYDGSYRTFIMQFNIEGVFDWGMYWDVPSGHYFTDIKMDKAGNVFASGSYESDLIMKDEGDNYSYTFIRPGDYKRGSYLLKFNNAGRFLWKTFMTPEASINSISIDDNGNAYAVGGIPWYYEPKGFEITEEDGSKRIIDPGSSFILKFNHSGHYLWSSGNKGHVSYSFGHSSLIKDNFIYFTFAVGKNEGGRMAYEITSANGKSIMHSADMSEFVLAKYSLDGNLERIYTSGENSGGMFRTNGIYIDQANNIVISGLLEHSYRGMIKYDAFGNELYSKGSDGFLIKLKEGLCFTGAAPLADAGPDKTSCSKEDIVIGGVTVSGNQYVWTSSANNSTYFSAQPTINPSVSATYYLHVTNNSGLTSIDSVYVNVNARPAIEAGKSLSICANNRVTLGSPVLDGVSYSWESLPAGLSSTSASPVVQPSVTTSYILTANNQQGCTAKDTVKLTVESFLLMSLQIKGPETACRGIENIYTADVKNAGDSAVYQWTINGKPVGENSAIFKSKDFKENDRLEVRVIPSLTCAFPQGGENAIRNIHMTDGRVPHAFILPMDTNVCVNQSVSFYVDEINQVRDISYEWRRNDAKAGGDNFTYIIKDPIDGDKVFAIVTASNGCAGRSADTTNIVTLRVGSLKPVVSVVGNNIVIKGQSTTIAASVTGAGTTSALRWEDSTSTHGWATIAGVSAQLWNYTPVTTGDRLRCVVTVSDQCSGLVQKASNSITFVVNAVTAIDADPIATFGVSVFPNPASGVLYLRNLDLADQWQSLTITGMDGKPVMITKDIRGKDHLDLSVATLPSGMYTLILNGKNGKRAFYKVILRR
jgi:photosystem II stability/assembly factor-like uncharacterized protein